MFLQFFLTIFFLLSTALSLIPLHICDWKCHYLDHHEFYEGLLQTNVKQHKIIPFLTNDTMCIMNFLALT